MMMVLVMTMVPVKTMVTENCLMQSCDKQLCDKQLCDKQMCDKPLRGVCRISPSIGVLSHYNSTPCSPVQIKGIAQCTASGAEGRLSRLVLGYTNVPACIHRHLPTRQPIRILLLAINQYEKQCADCTLQQTMRLHTLMHTLYPCIPYTPCIPRCIPYTSALPILDLASPLGSLLLSKAAACIHICIREIILAWLSPRSRSRIQVFNWQRTTEIFCLDNLWTKK